MLKHIGIPTLDISGRTDWQSIVDREKNQYLGHVTTAMTADGKTVYAVYPKCHALGQIVLKRSGDGGRSWSERLSVPASWTHSLECPTLFRMADAQGCERFFLFSGGYPAMRSVSEDGGRTFSEFEQLPFGGIVVLSAMACVGPGHYIALFHDEGAFIRGGHETLWRVYAAGEGANRRTYTTISRRENGAWGEEKKWWVSCDVRPDEKWELVYETECGLPFADGHFELYQIETADGGLTWTEPRVIANHETARLCEPCLVSEPNGKRLAVILRENARRMNSMMMLSTDQGRTWTVPVELPAALTGDRHVVRTLPDGRLFITFRDRCGVSDTPGDWIAWVGTWDDLVSGREGQYRVLIKRDLEGWDCAYAGLECLPDGRLLAVTYGHWEKGEAPYILAVRIDMAELDRLYAAAH